MKYHNYYLLALLLSLSTFAHAQKASDILAQAKEAYTQSEGISAHFSIHIALPDHQGTQEEEGTITMLADKFAWKTSSTLVWFDGHTQWTYLPEQEEVNISEPEEEELWTTNPIFFLNRYQKGFKAKYIGQSTAFSGKSAYDVQLTPRKKSDIKTVILQIEKDAYLPASISIELKDGTTSKIQVKEIKTKQHQTTASFTFPENNYPNVEIIDLR